MSPLTAADFKTAIAEIIQGENGDGVLWCDPDDSAEIVSVILSRRPQFGLYIRDLIRFVRALALCTASTPRRENRTVLYVDVLYNGLKAFRTEHFRNALRKATPPKDTLDIREDRVIFLEPAFQGATLYFSQMPKIATLLHFLHALYGFHTLAAETRVQSEVTGIFSPLTTVSIGLPISEERKEWWSGGDDGPTLADRRKSPPRNADELANALRAIVERDIRRVFGTGNVRSQFQALWTFVHKQQHISKPGLDAFKAAVTDETIFEFWRSHAVVEKKGDWREYKTVVVAMLRLFRALSMAAEERLLSKAAEGEASEEENGVWVERKAAQPVTGTWVSPLLLLRLGTNREIKFILKNSISRLSNYLDSALRNADDEDYSADDMDLTSTAEEAWEARRHDPHIGKLQGVVRRSTVEGQYVKLGDGEKPDRALMGSEKPQLALMGRDRFELEFLRTLLRVDIFGHSQSQLSDAISVAETPMCEGRDCYSMAQNDYRNIEDEILNSMLAATYRLGSGGDLESLQLIWDLTGPRGPQVYKNQEVYKYFREVASASEAILGKVSAAYAGDRNVPVEVRLFVQHTQDKFPDEIWGSDETHDLNGRADELFETLVFILWHAKSEVMKYFELDQLKDRAVRQLKSAFQRSVSDLPKPVVQFVRTCEAKAKTNKRQGFKPEDYPKLRKAFREDSSRSDQHRVTTAGRPLIDLWKELRRLNWQIDHFGEQQGCDLAEAAAQDCSTFAEVFQQLYPDSFH